MSTETRGTMATRSNIVLCFFLRSTLEYYRFLHIQEQCCLKWQTTNFRLGQLKKEHDKCRMIRCEMEAKFQQLSQSLLKERQLRRSAELERDILVSEFHSRSFK